MLSAQQKEIGEDPKKPAEASPYPRDFARWYALDYFKRPGTFKARRFWVTLGVTVAVTLASLASMAAPPWHHVHQAASVSNAHAMFSQQCSNCHSETFAPVARLFGRHEAVSIPDATCNACHHGASHNTKVSHDPSCVTCHQEHRGHEVLAKHVASRQCTECHRDLANHLKSGAATDFQASITSFNRDHPEFKQSRAGQKDESRIKFNHKAHLELSIDDLKNRADLKGLGSKLECAQCHQMDAERRYFLPINYEQHCAKCHQLNVALVGDFAKLLKGKAAEFGRTPLPHKEPAVVRAVLRDRLAEFAQKNTIVSVKSEPIALPRPLPWKPSGEVSKENWSWTIDTARQAEDLLFMNKQWQKAEPLTWCSHCHVEQKPNGRPGGLPVYQPTAIPKRWHEHSVFSHGAHRMMGCVECHDRNAKGVKVAHSESAEDILLPTIKSCQECHQTSGSARNSCVECHRYHDRNLQRSPDGGMTIDAVLGKHR